jgi:hypothetical protein
MPVQEYSELSEIFERLCGQHYGSVTIRRSFPLFQKCQKWDIERCQQQQLLLLPREIGAAEVVVDWSFLDLKNDETSVKLETMDWRPASPFTSSSFISLQTDNGAFPLDS